MSLSGVTMLPCGSTGAHAVLCLDVCGGYAGKLPGYDQYLYRYYMAGSTATGECSRTVENAGACSREEGTMIRRCMLYNCIIVYIRFFHIYIRFFHKADVRYSQLPSKDFLSAMHVIISFKSN